MRRGIDDPLHLPRLGKRKFGIFVSRCWFGGCTRRTTHHEKPPLSSVNSGDGADRTLGLYGGPAAGASEQLGLPRRQLVLVGRVQIGIGVVRPRPRSRPQSSNDSSATRLASDPHTQDGGGCARSRDGPLKRDHRPPPQQGERLALAAVTAVAASPAVRASSAVAEPLALLAPLHALAGGFCSACEVCFARARSR